MKKGNTEIIVQKDREVDDKMFVTVLGPPELINDMFRLHVNLTYIDSIDEDIEYRINIGKDWLTEKLEMASLSAFTETASWLRSLLLDNSTLKEREEMNVERDPMSSETIDNFLRPLRLNESQRRVVQMFNLHRPIVIQGPPGTGQTETVAILAGVSRLKYGCVGLCPLQHWNAQTDQHNHTLTCSRLQVSQPSLSALSQAVPV
jgi:hypothetical protein